MGFFFAISIYTIWHINPWYYKLPIAFFIFAISNIIGFLRYNKLNSVCSKHCGERRLDWCPYALGTEPAPEYLVYLETLNLDVHQKSPQTINESAS
jgi:hypothetical protein